MSEQNVELVRRGFEHFVATGEPAWDALHEVYYHDIMDGRRYRDHADQQRCSGRSAYGADLRVPRRKDVPLGPISITARRCGRRASQSRGQVPVSGVRPRSAKACSRPC